MRYRSGQSPRVGDIVVDQGIQALVASIEEPDLNVHLPGLPPPFGQGERWTSGTSIWRIDQCRLVQRAKP